MRWSIIIAHRQRTGFLVGRNLVLANPGGSSVSDEISEKACFNSYHVLGQSRNVHYAQLRTCVSHNCGDDLGHSPVEQRAETAGPALELAVRTDRQTYRMSEKIRMEAQLLNTGKEDVYIWDWDLCWNLARGLSMYVTKPDGKAVHGDFFLIVYLLPQQKATCTTSSNWSQVGSTGLQARLR